MKNYFSIFSLLVIFFLGCPASGSIRFEEVTTKAGVSKRSPTAGASWGDFNGDGWPDLWVVNHYLTPSLYLNGGDGTFSDVVSAVLYGQPIADYHGAAWADFDNDGDQDLLNLTGGGAGRGKCPNYLFVNQNGLLKDQAEQLGIDYPFGRGRTPLWFDADRDGRLDVLIMNKPRPGDQAPSALFQQTQHGFGLRSKELGLRLGVRSKFEKITALADNAIHLRFRRGPGSMITPEVFAQLGDLSGDGNVDLVAYSSPMRVFSIHSTPFKEITNVIGFPNINGILDLAIEDFNGDLHYDMYVAKSHPWASSVVRRDAFTLVGAFFFRDTPLGLQFRSKGKVTFGFYTPWKDPSDPLKDRLPTVFLGASGKQVNESTITLSPTDKTAWGPVLLEDAEKRQISIDYDNSSGLWTIHSTISYLDFTLKSTEPIEQTKTLGFTSSEGARQDKLLFQRNGHFTNAMDSPLEGYPSATRSVAAADFDNDMDMDLYLLCSGPAVNLPNQLYENDGKGNFTMVPNAGGAKGSEAGRGESVATADFDRDGFLDVFITNGGGFEPIAAEGPHQLFRNTGNTNHWLELDFEGTKSNRDGIGVQVLLETAGTKQVRTQNGGMHFMSQHHQRVHFGLGKNTIVDKLVVTWPSGIVQQLKNVPADQILHIREPD